MKTTLCETCKFGLVREIDYGKHNGMGIDVEKDRLFTNRCMLGGDYPGSYVTSCNRYIKKGTETTYHDPEWEDWRLKIYGTDEGKE